MLKKILLGTVLVLGVGLLASACFNLLYLQYLKVRFPAPGNFYEVNGRRMHIDCTGTGRVWDR